MKNGQYRPRLSSEEYRLLMKHREQGDVISDADNIKYTDNGDTSLVEGAILTTQTDRVKILEDFLGQCKVDRSIWDIDRYVLNAWDVTMKFESAEEGGDLTKTKTNYQIKVWLKRKTPIVRSLESLIDGLYERKVKAQSIEVSRQVTGLLYEICLFDHHFGKLCWKPETGEDFDLKIAKAAFISAMDKIHGHAKMFQPEQILFPLGNDFLHIDNDKNTTNKGTAQDVDGRLPKIYDVAYDSVIESIDRLLTISPVHIVWVASNHDLWVSYFLCKAIKAYYANNNNVTIDVLPKSRKMFQWGNVLIGYEHGEVKPERLPLLMADEWPDAWATSRFKEWHTGHLHKKQEMVFTSVDTYGSVIYRRIPSLTSTDAWHYQQGFINKTRAAEVYVWDKEKGLVSNFPIHID